MAATYTWQKEIEQFLKENEVNKDWKELILTQQEIAETLWKCIRHETMREDRYMYNYLPQRNCILRAFKYRSPLDIKVVIMDKEPIRHFATGLSMSMPPHWKPGASYWNQGESITYGQTVIDLHEVLHQVGYLERGQRYSYDHQEWAERGVLLWNFVPTTSPVGKDLWMEFSISLLCCFLQINPQISVHFSGDNWQGYAGQVWEDFCNKYSSINNFTKDCSFFENQHKRDIGLFSLQPLPPPPEGQLFHGEDMNVKIERFLELNEVHEAWRNLILNERQVAESLWECIRDATMRGDWYMYNYVPLRNCILRALKYCNPLGIKVIIMGKDPIPNHATGLSMSMPSHWKPGDGFWKSEDGELKWIRYGQTVIDLHEVLENEQVGYLQEGQRYSYDHQEWAERGVLLWNAVLILKTEYNQPLWQKWIRFSKSLLKELLKVQGRTGNTTTEVLCLGSWARQVGQDLGPENITITEHPAKPGGSNFKERAKPFFSRLKKTHPKLFALRRLPGVD